MGSPAHIDVVVLARMHAYRSVVGEGGVSASESDRAVLVVVADCRE